MLEFGRRGKNNNHAFFTTVKTAEQKKCQVEETLLKLQLVQSIFKKEAIKTKEGGGFKP